MAYPSNDNLGAKNLVDFVVHLRDANDSWNQTVQQINQKITNDLAHLDETVAEATRQAGIATAKASELSGTVADVDSIKTALGVNYAAVFNVALGA